MFETEPKLSARARADIAEAAKNVLTADDDVDGDVAMTYIEAAYLIVEG